MSAFDIIENDMFDSVAGKEEKTYEKNTAKKIVKATSTQILKLKQLYSVEEVAKALEMVKKTKLEDLTVQEASSLISKRMKKDEEK